MKIIRRSRQHLERGHSACCLPDRGGKQHAHEPSLGVIASPKPLTVRKSCKLATSKAALTKSTKVMLSFVQLPCPSSHLAVAKLHRSWPSASAMAVTFIPNEGAARKMQPCTKFKSDANTRVPRLRQLGSEQAGLALPQHLGEARSPFGFALCGTACLGEAGDGSFRALRLGLCCSCISSIMAGVSTMGSTSSPASAFLPG